MAVIPPTHHSGNDLRCNVPPVTDICRLQRHQQDITGVDAVSEVDV